MTSKVGICNLALIEAKYDVTIASMDERSVAAERCNRLYDVCRKELLAKYPWVFATRIVALARLDVEPEGFKYAYVYPENALRVVNVFPNIEDFKFKNHRVRFPDNTRVNYMESKKVILCNYEEPYAEIIYDEQIEENFPDTFVRLLYLEIALRLSKLSNGDTGYLSVIAQQIQQAETEARVQSVGEDDNHLCVEDDYYVLVRG